MPSCLTLSPRAQVARECLCLVNAHVRIADPGREGVGNVTLSDAHVAEVPGHAHNMDDTPIDMQRPHAWCHKRARFDFTTRGPERHPASVLDTFLRRQLRAELHKCLRLGLRQPGN